ncbi:MAG: hypothetical protein A3F84_21290 [Candidatus Handelsmanbacteria bacterium RIFCSPLOWO2_12_FULL_64_10]|uniref:MlrC domain protein n=1 Tax=Handelsmanbacteria sp. (strain RIFCSPLOWO2_12_FULL_64_10) TaxID=1817868 RepID=A0A1F6D6J3_HANXR|nr:MAG: hypothetical protein A3F84_21290 [Candidatus Handelsmanbacteria bacterium RIFCSPLOWO2_12_FULL_64_10]
MRILTACIGHETNTFAVTPTTLEDFRRGSAAPEFGGGEPVLDYFRGTRTIHGGYIDGVKRHGLTLEPLLWTFATPGGMVEQGAYDFLKGLLLERLRAAGRCDGVLLDLHGAMATEALEDAEGDLIASVRREVGAETPVVVTLDLHANVTAQMAQGADAIIGFDEYPHVDAYERGVEAAEVLAAILRGDLRPALAYHQLPLLTMPPRQCTLIEPMRSLLARARGMEQEAGVVNVTLAMGFPFTDIRDAGASVLVTTEGDAELARRKAEEMAGAIWERRDDFTPRLTPVSEAIAYARDRAKGLVVLADGSDNPGGGGPCDGTVILRQLIEEDAQGAVVAVIADAQAVAQAAAAGVGGRVTLDLGGKTDDRHGAPVRLTAHVRLLSDGTFVLRGPMGGGARARMGRTAVLVVGGVEVVVTERRIQPYDAALLRGVGIEPTERRLIALKSAVHFRSTYQDIAERIFDADTPGVHRPDFSCYTYRRVRRPVYPLDQTL